MTWRSAPRPPSPSPLRGAENRWRLGARSIHQGAGGKRNLSRPSATPPTPPPPRRFTIAYKSAADRPRNSSLSPPPPPPPATTALGTSNRAPPLPSIGSPWYGTVVGQPTHFKSIWIGSGWQSRSLNWLPQLSFFFETNRSSSQSPCRDSLFCDG